MQNRRKGSDRRTGTERRKGTSDVFKKGVEKGFFIDERKGERRENERRTKTQTPTFDLPPQPTGLNKASDPNLSGRTIEAMLQEIKEEYREQLEKEKQKIKEEFEQNRIRLQKESETQHQNALQNERNRFETTLNKLQSQIAGLEKGHSQTRGTAEIDELIKAREAELQRQYESLLEKNEEDYKKNLEALKTKLEGELQERESLLNESWGKKEIEMIENYEGHIESLRKELQKCQSENKALTEAQGKNKPAPKRQEPLSLTKEDYKLYLDKVSKKNRERQKTGQSLLYVYSYEEWVEEMKRSQS